MPPSRSPNHLAPSKEELEQADKSQNALLPMQEIMIEGQSKACVTFFNSGSNTNKICRAFAESLGLPGSPVTQRLQVTGKQPEEWQTFSYRIRLIRNSGEVENVIAFGIEDIAAELPKVDLGPIITMFQGTQLNDIKRPTGHVDLLLGIQEARLFLTQVLQSQDNLLLCQSIFCSGLLLTDHHAYIKPGVVLQSQHIFEKGQALYGKRIHHVLNNTSFNSHPSSSVDQWEGQRVGEREGVCIAHPYQRLFFPSGGRRGRRTGS